MGFDDISTEFHDLIGDEKVFVKELPDNCACCPFCEGSYITYTCLITLRKQDDYTGMKRMRGCPLRLRDKKKGKEGSK